MTSNQNIVVGDTVPFEFAPTRGGVTYDLSGADVTVYIKDPNGTVTEASTPGGVSLSGGKAYYTSPEGLFDSHGDWKMAWRVEKAGVRLTTPYIKFPVLATIPDAS
jgi:hypothetical protein